MKKLIVLAFLIPFVTFSSAASVITHNNYLSFDKNDDGVFDFDIVWASPIVSQFIGCSPANPENYYTAEYTNPACFNQLFTPSGDWQYFEDVDGLELSDAQYLYDENYFDDPATALFISGFELFNTNGSGLNIFATGYSTSVVSNWTINTSQLDFYTNVFYARNHDNSSGAVLVSEPSVFVIFMLSMISLSLGKRYKKGY